VREPQRQREVEGELGGPELVGLAVLLVLLLATIWAFATPAEHELGPRTLETTLPVL
jgi:hypothetical protein